MNWSLFQVLNRLSVLMVFALTAAISGCSTTTPTLDTSQPDVMQKLAFDGIQQMQKGKFENARKTFSVGLRNDPRSCTLNTLNALSYQLEGRDNNVALLNLAMAGYKIATRFCPNDPWPYYYSGVISLQTKHYLSADKNFKIAVDILKDTQDHGDLTALYRAYLYSAYKSGQVKDGQEALAQLSKLAPNSPLVKPLHGLYSKLDKEKVKAKGAKSPADSAKVSSAADDGAPKQLLVDAVLILSREVSTEKKGINLLDDLSITMSGTGSYANNTPSSYAWNFSFNEVQYDLSVFNTITEQDQILARPTIMVQDGKEANYFVGNDLYLGLSGSDYGSFEEIPLGLTLKVTPTFNSNGSIQLKADVEREILTSTDEQAAGFDESTESVKQSSSSTVTLNYDETAILGTLSEADEGESRNRTPLLSRIPGIKHLFDRHETEKISTQLLILLTPRKYVSFNTKFVVPPEKALRNFYMGLVSPSTNLTQVMRWLRALDIYYRPERLTPLLYSKRTLDKALTDEYSIDGGNPRDLLRMMRAQERD